MKHLKNWAAEKVFLLKIANRLTRLMLHLEGDNLAEVEAIIKLLLERIEKIEIPRRENG